MNCGEEILQRDLDSIKNWAVKWKMEFNVDKCKVMHLGSGNPRHTYTMGGEDLAVTTEEKDLGVIFDEKLEFSKHIKVIVGKANRMLGMIRRGFTCLDREIFKLLYPVLVRPLLEYCVQVWSPNKQMDIDLIEKVQKRAVKMVPGMKDLSYEERLVKLGLTKLVERRFRGDMIETYKLLTNKEGISRNIFFELRPDERGNPEANRGLIIFKERTTGRNRRK